MTLGSAVSGGGRTKPVDKVILPWRAVTSDVNGPAVWVIDPRNHTVSLRGIAVDTYTTAALVVRGGASVNAS